MMMTGNHKRKKMKDLTYTNPEIVRKPIDNVEFTVSPPS